MKERQTREQAKAATREALLAAALRLFTEKGIEGPSLDAISEAAGYTRGAFYVHFKSRDELLQAVMERILAEYIETIVQTADAGGDLARSVGTFVHRLEEVADGTASPFVSVSSAHLRVLFEATARNEGIRERFLLLVDGAVARLSTVVAAGKAAGTVRADVDPVQVSMLLIYVVFGILTLRPGGFAPAIAPTASQVLQLLSPRET